MTEDDPSGYRTLMKFLYKVKHELIARGHRGLADEVSFATTQLMGSGSEFMFESKRALESVIHANLDLEENLKSSIIECIKQIDRGLRAANGYSVNLQGWWEWLTRSR